MIIFIINNIPSAVAADKVISAFTTARPRQRVEPHPPIKSALLPLDCPGQQPELAGSCEMSLGDSAVQ